MFKTPDIHRRCPTNKVGYGTAQLFSNVCTGKLKTSPASAWIPTPRPQKSLKVLLGIKNARLLGICCPWKEIGGDAPECLPHYIQKSLQRRLFQIPNESAQFLELNIDEDSYLPAIFLYFSDDLTEL